MCRFSYFTLLFVLVSSFHLLLSQAQENSSSSSTKKKNKFVNLYNKEGQDRLAVLLPGRHSCECLAQKHKLINNCISCGRIVCEQEGSGPCLFCGSLVRKSFETFYSFYYQSTCADSPFSLLSINNLMGLFSDPGLHERGAGDPATRLQQKPETKKEAFGRWASKLVRIIKYSDLCYDVGRCFILHYFIDRRWRKRLSPTPRGHDEGWPGEGCAT